jgi:hypothetical protein
LFPFNLDRVLSSMPKLAIGPFTASTADIVIVGPRSQEQIPQTPVTPVSAEGLMSLQNLDKESKQSLQRHVLKFSKAA